MKTKKLLLRKVFILFFISLSMSLIVNAQTWTAPTFEHQSDDLSTHVGEVFYLYNVGAGSYVTYGANYGTRAVLGPVGYPMYLRQSGSNYKFEFVTSPKHNGSTYYLFCPNGSNPGTTNGTVFTDNSTKADWTCAYDATSKSYTISNTASASTYLTPDATVSTSTQAGNGFASGTKSYNLSVSSTTNDNYAKWRFVTPTQKALLDLSVLFTYVTNNSSLGIDLTSYISVYSNTSSSLTDLTTAISNLRTAIFAKASASNPIDITSFTIANPSFEQGLAGSLDGWIVPTGSLRTTNGAEINATFPAAGAGYVDNTLTSGNIPAFILKQTLSSLPVGKYSLKAIVNGDNNGSTTPSNFSLFAGNSSTNITTFTANSAAQYEVPNILLYPAGNTTVDIGLNYTTGANWLAVDNFQLFYYGQFTDPDISLSTNQIFFEGNNQSKTFTVYGANITDNVVLSPPSGVTLDKNTLTPAEVNAGVVVTATYSNTVAFTSGAIAVSSGSITKNITITVSADAVCYTPLYSGRTNMIVSPYCNDISKFNGWGNKANNTDPAYIYCGTGSIKVYGGSIDASKTGSAGYVNFQSNKTYRAKAMIYVPAGNVAKFGLFHIGNTADVDIYTSSTNDAWEVADFTFKTATVTDGGIFYQRKTGTGNVYIDNYELYEVTEPTIRIKYVDAADANTSLQADRVYTSTWGTTLSNYLTIGKTYSALASDKVDITYNGYVYSYDNTSIDNVTIDEGEKVITLKFTKNLSTGLGRVGSKINVYPTNSNGTVNVLLDNSNGLIKVFDIAGRVMLNKVVSSTKEVVTLPTTGIFFLEVSSNNVTEKFKVICIK